MSPTRTSRGRLPVARPLVAALSALLPLVAAAQETPAAKDPVALDALQVTAQRRVENAKDVPVALSAIQGEKLDVLGSAGDDIRFLAARVPSLNIESSYGRAFRASTSAAWATPISTSMLRSRCRWCMTTWCRKARC